MYKVRIERKVQKNIDKILEPYYSKVKSSILNLAANPRPHGCKKLKDETLTGFVSEFTA